MVVHRDNENNSFKFSVYRKNTHTNTYIHYFSYHEMKIKSNVLTNLFFRAFRICDPQFIDQEINYLIESFKKLCYPKFFIQQCLSRARSMYFIPRDRQNKVDYVKSLPLPYTEELSKFGKRLNKANSGFDVVFKYNNTTKKKLVKNNPVSKEDVGVYVIPCKDCTKCYVGESGRCIDKRKEEHIAACRRGNTYSAVAQHTWETNHAIDFQGTKIIYKSQDKTIRRVVEGAVIQMNNTFRGNTGYAENVHISQEICKKAKIKKLSNICANDDAASSLATLTQETISRSIQQADDHRNIPPRRSQRILARTRTQQPI